MFLYLSFYLSSHIFLLKAYILCKQHSVADNQNCLTQFELAIARKSNLFRCSPLCETSRYIDLNTVLVIYI